MAKNPSNRFVWDDDNPIEIRSRCHLCKHKFRGHPGCSAFPQGLPHAIAIGDVMHWPDRPFQGDQGIRFELNPDMIGKLRPEVVKELKAAGVYPEAEAPPKKSKPKPKPEPKPEPEVEPEPDA